MRLPSSSICKGLSRSIRRRPATTSSYFFKYVDHRESDVAADAFLELARASDKDLGQAAAKFDAAKVRAWVQDAKLPADRLNLYGFILGVCGTDRDAVLLRGMLQKPDDRIMSAYQGILCGYIQLRPREGWELAHGDFEG